MKHTRVLMPICLGIHDAAAAGAVGAQGAQSGAEATPAIAQQEENATQLADVQTDGVEGAEVLTPEDKKASFRRLIATEYKDEFADLFQDRFDKRFKEHRQTAEQLEAAGPVLTLLGERYGVQDGDATKLLAALEQDDALWEGLADEAGLSPAQYREQLRMRRELDSLRRERAQQDEIRHANAIYASWQEQAKELAADFPDFDLGSEMQNESFCNLLGKGVDVRAAYQATHFDSIVSGVAGLAGRRAEEHAMRKLQSKASRPLEGGAKSAPAALMTEDISKMSAAQRRDIARRAQRGEMIAF